MAAIALPHMDQYLPGVQAHSMRAISNIDHARGHALGRFEAVQDQIWDHGRMFGQLRNNVPQVRPYMS